MNTIGDWVGVLTLLVTLLTLVLTVLMYRSSLGSPWSLTKLDDTSWLLERTHWRPASIIAEYIPQDIIKVDYKSPHLAPQIYFQRGTKVVIELVSEHRPERAKNPTGAEFILLYKEHWHFQRINPDYLVLPQHYEERVKLLETRQWNRYRLLDPYGNDRPAEVRRLFAQLAIARIKEWVTPLY